MEKTVESDGRPVTGLKGVSFEAPTGAANRTVDSVFLKEHHQIRCPQFCKYLSLMVAAEAVLSFDELVVHDHRRLHSLCPQ